MIIKQKPEDFVVEEVIELKLDDAGEYTYFWLNKTNWTTMRALQTIARYCRTSIKRFRFAGNKDKFAVTKQAISVWKVDPEKIKNLKIKDITLEIIGKGKEELCLGDLIGNKFKIILRDLTDSELKKIKANVEKYSAGFPNYFGEQRFGKGNTHLIGREILKGNLEEAVKYVLTFEGENEGPEAKAARKAAAENWGNWGEVLKTVPRFLGIESTILNHLVKTPSDFAGALRDIPKPIRKMYVHAYQSYLFNSALKKVHKNGEDLDKDFPVPGTETVLGDDTFSKEVKRLLKKEKIKLEDFKCARMPELESKGNTRRGLSTAKNLKVLKVEDDDMNSKKKALTLEFELDKGNYATTFLEVLAE